MRKQEPPIDWLKAAILERMEVQGFTRAEVCELSGVSGTTFRTMMKADAATWDFDNRRAILKALHIKVADFPKDVQLDIVSRL